MKKRIMALVMAVVLSVGTFSALRLSGRTISLI